MKICKIMSGKIVHTKKYVKKYKKVVGNNWGDPQILLPSLGGEYLGVTPSYSPPPDK
jgi:hypothetical protein